MSEPNDRLEIELVEEPAAEVLRVLFDYKSLAAEDTKRLRGGNLSEAVLSVRLAESLKRLNPWLDHDGVRRAVDSVTRIAGADLIETNETGYVTLTYGATAPFTDEFDRRQDRTVRFFDFDDVAANTFEFARQVPIKGPRQNINPDIIVYVNGLPLAVIECKSPALADPMAEAIRQFRRYEGRDDFLGLGAPRLFETAQLSIALARDVAKYGTTATPQRAWAEWKDCYPLTPERLTARLGRAPTAQDTLLAGLLAPENLLDLVRNFIIFESSQGRRVKKIARYQQFVAVGKTIDRIRRAPRPDRRGGVIHHTQGSGKSLTMVFLAVKLRRLPEAENPTLLIVTDRVDLHDQITAQFQRAGFPNPGEAESGADLRERLSGGAGPTVLTTVHKFHTAVPSHSDVISDASNIFVMVDEAHRTQYGALAARMRAGLPNACMIAFTGTPIDKRDRSTREVFGDYIHRYLIDQAVKDGATVPIYYEMRDARMRIEGRDLDRDLRASLPDLTDTELDQVRKSARLQEQIAGSSQRIEAICKDIIAHYRSVIEPNGFKAQVVTISRDVAVTCVDTLRRLGGPECAVIMSASNNDAARLRRHHLSKKERDDLIARFKRIDDPLRILVVCDMLLTGFDAPVEQVMYLDAPLREHTLLQAIARVNRTADGKTYGLVVDYWGDNRRISEALEMFSEEDGVFTALRPLSEKMQLLESRHRAAMRLFDDTPRDDETACLDLLRHEDVRAKFELDFQRFAEAMDMVLPNPNALEPPYSTDIRWLARLRAVARRLYRDERLDVQDYGAKVSELISKHLKAEGVEQILAPQDILDPAFQQHLAEMSSTEAKAAEIEHAIRHEIHVHHDQNPEAYRSLWEELDELISRRRQDRIAAAAYLGRLEDIVARAGDARAGRGQRTQLSGVAGAILPLLALPTATPREQQEEIARAIASDLEEYASVIDWTQKEDIKRRMRRVIKDHLRVSGTSSSDVEAATMRIMDVARARLAK